MEERITPTTVPKIPYVNIARQHVRLKAELLQAISGVLERGDFILGREVEEFEKCFSELCGVRFAVAVNSGTDALILALRVLGICAGDQVITAPNSFVATASCIRMVGARPVFVDVREDYNLDPGQMEKVITAKTKAVIPVHLTGRPADMDPILEIAKKHHLYVIEDAAQAVLAEYRGKSVGSFGVMGCFSLHPLKTLSACGDGGVLTTQDETLYKRLKTLRNLGLINRNECTEWSGNSRLDTIQAAMLLVKLKYVHGWTEKRRTHALFYQRRLNGVSSVVLPNDRSYEKAVYHTFVIQADDRDELKDFLAQKGIDTSVHYPLPIHLQKAAQDLGYREGSFPVAERQAKRVLSLPIYPELSENDLDYIADCIKQFFGSHSG